jgi:hypothetical protein
VARPALRLTVEPTPGETVPVAIAGPVAHSAGIALVPVLGHSPPTPREGALPVVTVGVATRYLVSVADKAAQEGWERDELVALVSELERRTVQWVAANTVASLRPSVRRLPSRPGSGRAVLLLRGRWHAAVCAATDAERLVRGAAGRNAVCLVAGSGTRPPRWVSEAVGRWRAAGVRAGEHQGTAAELRARWSLEVVIAPRITTSGLPSLREQLAATPRCGWCHLPVPGASCRHCLPEWAS